MCRFQPADHPLGHIQQLTENDVSAPIKGCTAFDVQLPPPSHFQDWDCFIRIATTAYPEKEFIDFASS